MSRVLVVIPMFGKHEYTERCIQSCKENAGIQHDILVVDDGSEEPFHNYDVNVLRLDKNVGFTEATNQGFLWAGDRYEYIHMLNNDTEPEKDFLKLLVEFMDENPVVGIAGSVRRLIGEEKINLELYGADLIRGYQMMCEELPKEEVIFTHWVPLCSALIRHKMMRYIGLLDKMMRTWCSDNDYCIRANFNGWNVALVTRSIVKHHHQVTTGKHINVGVTQDQKVLIEKMAGVNYAELMRNIPLDCEQNTFGKLNFEVYKKK